MIEIKNFFAMEIENEVDVIFEVSHSVPLFLIGDEQKIKQVLINLIGNSFKFTHTGFIVVSTTVTSKSENCVNLMFQVKDSGIGIEQNKIPKLFNSFIQADESISKKYGGTGLGLAITKELVDVLNGKMQLETTFGNGTSVFIELSLKSVEDYPIISCNNLNIVFIGNNFLYEFIYSNLKEYGFNNIFHNPLSIKIIDILIVDEDSLSHLEISPEQINEFNKISSKIILIRNIKNDASDHIKNFPSFFVNILIKPISIDELISIITLSQSEHEKSDILLTPEDAASFLNLNIAVIEDNPVNIETISQMLKIAKITPKIYTCGINALKDIENSCPDIILTDIQLPDISGFEILKKIRQIFPTKELPVIAVTAHLSETYKNRCLLEGFSGFLSKPFTVKELFEIIAATLDIEIDHNTINSWIIMYQKNYEIMSSIRKIAFKSIEESIALLYTYITSGNYESLKKEIHKMKSSLGNINAEHLIEKCDLIEKMLKIEENSKIISLINMLEKDLAKLR